MNRPVILRIQEQAYALAPEKNNDVIDQSVHGSEIDDQTADYHERDEVGHVGHGLHKLLERLPPQLIHQQCQYDRCREPEQQLKQAQEQCIAQKAREIQSVEKRIEMLHAHPAAGLNPAGRRVILERNLRTVQRHIVEQNEIDNHGYEHQIDAPMPDKIPAQRHTQGFPVCHSLAVSFHCFPSLHSIQDAPPLQGASSARRIRHSGSCAFFMHATSRARMSSRTPA